MLSTQWGWVNTYLLMACRDCAEKGEEKEEEKGKETGETKKSQTAFNSILEPGQYKA